MSLSYAMDVASKSLLITGSKTQTVAQNILNADKAGYTRKESQTIYATTATGSVPANVVTVGTTDRFLTKAVINDVSSMGKNAALNEILDYYASKLGATADSSTTLSSYLDDMYGALQQLSTSPEILANKSEVVQVATNMAASIRGLSGEIQNLRLQADQKIASSVETVNSYLDKLDTLNKSILAAQTDPTAVASFEDERMYTLEKLGQELDIQYFFTSDNQVQVYTGGQALLTTSAHKIDYSKTTQVTGSTTYPGGFGPITVNGTDITKGIKSGTLAGLIDARDNVLVAEQHKLDEFSNVMRDEANNILNKGASLPPQPKLTGADTGFTGTTAFSATGSVRIAVTDNNGIVKSYSDINLAGMTSINDVLTALNGVANINASINSNGQLVIASTLADTGVAINEMTSSVGAGNDGFSNFFGLNDFFTGTGAEDFKVKNELRTNPNYLATGALSSGTIAVGDYAVTRGDGSIATSLASLLNSNVSFDSAGDFSAQSNTLNRYASSIIAAAASKASIAQTEYDTSETAYTQTKTMLSSQTGVNIDEENTKLLDLQNSYQAAAQLISTIQSMFDALLSAVR